MLYSKTLLRKVPPIRYLISQSNQSFFIYKLNVQLFIVAPMKVLCASVLTCDCVFCDWLVRVSTAYSSGRYTVIVPGCDDVMARAAGTVISKK